MADQQRSTVVVHERVDARTDGPKTGGEREVLDHFLELYRETVLLKIVDLDAEQLARRALPPSSLSLVGVVRHLTEVEAYWLRVVLLDEQDVLDYYCTLDSTKRGSAGGRPVTYDADLYKRRNTVK
uniref:mycothiol transferase n=1 Tax=uncultured Pseudokineococcus sp. TaxID=1642928 RepID=UPI00262E3137